MRNDIELLRIISMFGIVWFHSMEAQWHDIAYGGLIFFIVVSIYFAIVSTHNKKPNDRLKRLIVPFVIWSVFYGFFNIITGGGFFYNGSGFLLIDMISGTRIHLWYLPYMYIVLILIDYAKVVFAKHILGVISGLAFVLLLLSSPVWRGWEYVSPLGQYIHAFPAVLIGVYFGCYFNIGCNIRVAVLIVIMLSTVVMACFSEGAVGVTYLVGVVPCLLLLRTDILPSVPVNISVISSLMFGTYLVHIFILFILRHFGFEGAGWPIAAFLISIVIVSVIKIILPERLNKCLV